FSDGTPLDSAAVRFTFERLADPNHEYHRGIAWGDAILDDWFERIETPDAHTAVFHLNRPFLPLLYNLAIPPASIVNPAHVKASWPDDVVTKPMGSGPYVLEEWKPGTYVKLKARESHWRGTPKTETLFFSTQKDANQRMSGLRQGSTHLVPV